MKKFNMMIFIIVISLFATSCTSNKPLKPDMTKVQIGGDGNTQQYGEKDIEPDVNDISIKEDNKMTNKALKNNNVDYTIGEKSKTDAGNSSKTLNTANLTVTKWYKTVVPSNIGFDILYKKYLMPYDYLLITKDKVKIFNKPSTKSSFLGEANTFEKVKLNCDVKGEYIDATKTNKWYGITWYNKDGKIVNGFIPDGSGEVRSYRFNDMITSIVTLENALKNNNYAYISNYKDINGAPPLLNGKGYDKYGKQAYQSAPAYPNLNDKTNFRYLPDGLIVFITGEVKGYLKIKSFDYEGEYWIPKKYISFDNNLDNFVKAVVVDTTNQNEAVFEKRGAKWTMISYNLATTGAKTKNKFETPIGKFKVLEKKDRFYYIDDTTKELAGYAPYGIRFAQGAYIHGIPVEFVKKNGELVDPGIKEYLFTVGTVPRSHKCVRNYSSHAKFLFNWADPNNTAVITIK